MTNKTWEDAKRAIQNLKNLPQGWDGDNASPILQNLIDSALILADQLSSMKVPNDIYCLYGGNIILEWRHDNEVIDRIEVESVGKGQRMISVPNTDTIFSDISWS